MTSVHERQQTGYADSYAAEALADVERRIGRLTGTEHDQLYGALYAAAATGSAALLDPAQANTAALAELVRTGRNGGCRKCGSPLQEHELDVARYPWLSCPGPAAAKPTDRGRRMRAWALWVAVPLLSLGLLSWLPSLVAALRHRGRGWGIATGLLLVFTLSFWTQPDVLAGNRMILWLGACLYGATQVKAWMRENPGPSC